MPHLHQDKSTRLNLERNLRRSRRNNKETPESRYYETSEDDPRPIADPELEYEADKSGMIHLRKSTKGNQVLPGYGTENFGVSSFEEKSRYNPTSLIVGAGLGTAGFFGWRFREEVKSGFGVLANYVLLMREALRES